MNLFFLGIEQATPPVFLWLLLYLTWLLVRRVHKHVLGDCQGAVVGLGGNPQELTHERVDMYAVKRLSQVILLEIWPKSSEYGLHVRVDVIKAMVSFVEIYYKLLKNNNKKAVLDPSSLKENCPLVNIMLVGSTKSLKM